jgi:hypothetical protein
MKEECIMTLMMEKNFGSVVIFLRNSRFVIRPTSHNSRGVLFNGDRYRCGNYGMLTSEHLKMALLESHEYLQEFTEEEAYTRRDSHPIDDGIAFALGSKNWKTLAKSKDCVMLTFGRGPRGMGVFGLEFPDYRRSHGITTSLAEDVLGLDLKFIENPTDDELVDKVWEYIPHVVEKLNSYITEQQ